MKQFVIYTLVLFGLVMLFAFAGPEKRINRLVSKVWKDQEFILRDVALPDSLATAYQALQSVHINDKVEGYVCYTTAFGCRIGGCPAPTNANVQSYETFDYIVIYNTDIKILKVDIVRYGGDYGYEICNPRWLRQFVGATSGFKLNDNVDGVAGATVSASFLIDDLNAIGNDLKKVLKSQENL